MEFPDKESCLKQADYMKKDGKEYICLQPTTKQDIIGASIVKLKPFS